jgi:hypothetical protein
VVAYVLLSRWPKHVTVDKVGNLEGHLPVGNPELAKVRAQRRIVEDRIIEELAMSGWSEGLAAIELDLDFSQLGRHLKRLGVTWTRYPNRSQKGTPVSGLAELQRLRAKVRGLTRPRDSVTDSAERDKGRGHWCA